MGGDGFTDEGLAALAAVLARHTSTGAVPGLVALVATKLARFTSMYAPREAAAAFGASGDAAGQHEANRGDLVLIDRPDGWYAAPPTPRSRSRYLADSKAWPTSVTAGPGLNRPVVPLPAEVGRANQA
jgi:hypothetical protein